MDRLQAVMLLAAVLTAAVAALSAFILKQRAGAGTANAVLYGGSTAVTLMLVYFTALGAYR
ncbi:MAG TPA: hypothetical protein VLH10_15140 [Yinghuangia sp.]|nr:hypothetical protein [Yinghuangia sp.]